MILKLERGKLITHLINKNISLSNKEGKNLRMKRLTIWFKKLNHGVNTKKGFFITGTFFGLLTWLTRSIISINQEEDVINAFLYCIPFGVMAASPFLVVGIIKYPKSRGKTDP